MKRDFKKILILSLFLLSGFIFAQTHRFFYELSFKADSTQIDFKKKIMVLDINPNEIKYYDNDFLEKDSLNKKFNAQNTNWTSQIPVIRKKNSYANINFAMVGFQVYSFPTEDNVSWYLSQKTKKYQGFNLQKATSTFGGRTWTAWFTKDIPFSEGPYKFRGLPGLIVLLEDNNKQFKFNLIRNRNLAETYDTANFLEVRYGNKPLAINEKTYVAKKMEYFNDPYHEVREGLRNGTTKSFDNNGIRYKNANDLIPLIKSEQEYILKNNNPIELSKAIKYLK